MSGNSFGEKFRITTFGESHGRSLGVVIDGCPSGIAISEEDIDLELERRAPGNHPFTSPRKEPDKVEIQSGVFEGKTTGMPIALIIKNQNARSEHYTPIKDLLRPGHANYTYLKKYGIFDYRGGGRASARETVARVAAGAIAKKILSPLNLKFKSQILEIGGEKDPEKFLAKLQEFQKEGDTLGGIIEMRVESMPCGLGDPVFDKLEARLACAMLGIPACKGFEMGEGFSLAKMKGSETNDLFIKEGDEIKTSTNYSGGVLGGISNGMPLFFRVAFKPASSIKKKQETLTLSGEKAILELPEGSRHDPCVLFRALPVVEAMTALVLADLYL